MRKSSAPADGEITFIFVGEPNRDALRMLCEDILKFEALAEVSEAFEIGKVWVTGNSKVENFNGVMVKARRRLPTLVAGAGG